MSSRECRAPLRGRGDRSIVQLAVKLHYSHKIEFHDFDCRLRDGRWYGDIAADKFGTSTFN